jgi:hypothetical protein
MQNEWDLPPPESCECRQAISAAEQNWHHSIAARECLVWEEKHSQLMGFEARTKINWRPNAAKQWKT